MPTAMKIRELSRAFAEERRARLVKQALIVEEASKRARGTHYWCGVPLDELSEEEIGNALSWLDRYDFNEMGPAQRFLAREELLAISAQRKAA
jgi:hypothetical protein